MKEIWKDIKNFEGYYQISSLGRIKSLKRNILKEKQHKKIEYNQKEKILTPSNLKNGYLIINLSKDSKIKRYLVHRLAAETFLDKTNFKLMPYENKNSIDFNKLQVNHKDENKQNNKIDNLEWCTFSYNMNYGTKLYRQSIAQINNSKNSKEINQYDLQGNFIKKWISMKEIERQLGIYSQHIYRCCKGKRKSTGGYKWEYSK